MLIKLLLLLILLLLFILMFPLLFVLFPGLLLILSILLDNNFKGLVINNGSLVMLVLIWNWFFFFCNNDLVFYCELDSVLFFGIFRLFCYYVSALFILVILIFL